MEFDMDAENEPDGGHVPDNDKVDPDSFGTFTNDNLNFSDDVVSKPAAVAVSSQAIASSFTFPNQIQTYSRIYASINLGHRLSDAGCWRHRRFHSVLDLGI